MAKKQASAAKGKKKDWIDRLRPQAKAEILGSVLHELECAAGKNYKAYLKLPRKWRKLVEAAMKDCSVWHSDLSTRDSRLIREWFDEQRKSQHGH
jgi:hypothetical protein